MDKCETCRHWTPLSHRPYAGECEALTASSAPPTADKAPFMFAWETEYAVSLETSHNFGCVLHEAKP